MSSYGKDLENARDSWILKRFCFLVDNAVRVKNPQRADAILKLLDTVRDELSKILEEKQNE